MMRQDFSLLGRRSALGLALAGLLVDMPMRAFSAEAGGDAIAPVQRLDGALMASMKAGRGVPFEQRVATLAPVVGETFDLETVLAASVGLNWSALPNDQKSALREAFHRYTAASYAASFDSFNGQSFQVAPSVRAVGNGDVVVRSKVIAADGSATPIDYVMRNGPSGWRAIDVLAGGSISRVAVQRSDFRSLLANGGVPALMTALRNKVANMQAA